MILIALHEVLATSLFTMLTITIHYLLIRFTTAEAWRISQPVTTSASLKQLFT